MDRTLVDRARRQVEAGLSECSLLKALSASARRKLASAGRLVCLETGEALFKRGETSRALFIVLDGEVEICAVFSDGQQLRFAVASAGGLVGEMGALDGHQRSADIVAIRTTRLWCVPRRAVIDILREETAAAISLISELGGRLRAANLLLQETALQNLAGRLARLLINEANRSGIVALTQVEMARRVSASREKVNRKLHQFVAAGIVSLTRAGVRVLQRDKLLAHFHDLST